MPAPRRITVEIQGAVADQGHVRLSTLIDQLATIKATLARQGRGAAGYYRIVGASHRSPLRIVLEHATPGARSGGDPAIAALMSDLSAIRSTKEDVPPIQDMETLELYEHLARTVDQQVERLIISSARRQVTIDKRFQSKLKRLVGPDEVEFGAIAGHLEQVNLHGRPKFVIYPLAGPSRITCRFRRRLRKDVVRALDQYVTVYGRLKLKSWNDHPHEVEAEEIEVHPPTSELPSLSDLRGFAPGLTNGASTEEFLAGIRDDGES